MPRPQIRENARVAAFVLGASRTRYLVMREEDVWFITFNGEEFGPYRSEHESMLFATEPLTNSVNLAKTHKFSGSTRMVRQRRYGPTVSIPIRPRRRSRIARS